MVIRLDGKTITAKRIHNRVRRQLLVGDDSFQLNLRFGDSTLCVCGQLKDKWFFEWPFWKNQLWKPTNQYFQTNLLNYIVCHTKYESDCKIKCLFCREENGWGWNRFKLGFVQFSVFCFFRSKSEHKADPVVQVEEEGVHGNERQWQRDRPFPWKPYNKLPSIMKIREKESEREKKREQTNKHMNTRAPQEVERKNFFQKSLFFSFNLKEMKEKAEVHKERTPVSANCSRIQGRSVQERKKGSEGVKSGEEMKVYESVAGLGRISHRKAELQLSANQTHSKSKKDQEREIERESVGEETSEFEEKRILSIKTAEEIRRKTIDNGNGKTNKKSKLKLSKNLNGQSLSGGWRLIRTVRTSASR